MFTFRSAKQQRLLVAFGITESAVQLAILKAVNDSEAAGADVETMVATGLGAEWADWSWNFINEERWIRTLFNDLVAE